MRRLLGLLVVLFVGCQTYTPAPVPVPLPDPPQREYIDYDATEAAIIFYLAGLVEQWESWAEAVFEIVGSDK